MPDGDKYHIKLRRCYNKSYEMLCEDKFSSDEIKRRVLKETAKSIKNLGEDIFDHIEFMGREIDRVFNIEALSKSDRCSMASRSIEQLKYSSHISLRAKNILLDAAKCYIRDVNYGKLSFIGSHDEHILTRCFERVLQNEFIEPIGLIKKHYNNMEPKEVQLRLNSIGLDIKQNLKTWAKKASESQSFNSLKLSRREKKPVSLDEDLL